MRPATAPSPSKRQLRVTYFLCFVLTLSLAVWVLASAPLGVNVILALTFTLCFWRRVALAGLLSLRGTTISPGPPLALEGFSRTRRFPFAPEASRGEAASLTATVPVALDLIRTA